jgi:hypothetical protein
MRSAVKKRKTMKRILVCSLLSSTVLAKEPDNGFLRRHRTNQKDIPTQRADSNADREMEDLNQKDVPTQRADSNADRKMEDLWEHAIVAANLEIERERNLFSHDFAMSMPQPTSKPTNPTNPTAAPVKPTPSPTQAPVNCLQGKTREQYIFDLISPITPASILNDSSTPQGKAFAFMASDDPGLQDPCSSSTIEQRYGLTTFYYALEGENWLQKDGWLGSNQECEWLGVECGDNSDEIQFLQLSTSFVSMPLLSATNFLTFFFHYKQRKII